MSILDVENGVIRDKDITSKFLKQKGFKRTESELDTDIKYYTLIDIPYGNCKVCMYITYSIYNKYLYVCPAHIETESGYQDRIYVGCKTFENINTEMDINCVISEGNLTSVWNILKGVL